MLLETFVYVADCADMLDNKRIDYRNEVVNNK